MDDNGLNKPAPLTPEIAELKKRFTDQEKIRAIYEFACDLAGSYEYEDGTAFGELLEELSNVVSNIEYCGLV